MARPRTSSTLTELAGVSGKTKQAVLKQMRRHGVAKNISGRYPTVQALDAMATGARLDKSKQEEQLAQLQAQGHASTDFVVLGKKAAIRRIALQGDILEIERDKAKGKLADVDEVVRRIVARHAEMITRLVNWRETCIAKFPALRAQIEEVAGQLQLALSEGWE